MFEAGTRIVDYVISKGIPFIILLIVIYLVYRYFVYGKGNKTLLCPSFFGSGYNYNCLNKLGRVVDNQGNLIKISELQIN